MSHSITVIFARQVLLISLQYHVLLFFSLDMLIAADAAGGSAAAVL
jgi:hypothetical protein